MAEVKICGLSTAETMEAALEAGADYVGLVFFAKSPRNVSYAKAEDLAAMARTKQGVAVVALVVDATDDELSEIHERVTPDFFQLHGNESPQRVREIAAKFSDTGLIKAIKVETKSDIEKAAAYAPDVQLILFDAKEPASLANALPGGNGVSFDWWLLGKAEGDRGRFMLAGGLNPGNVAEAITLTGAPIVDVSSGVETAPGKKDAALIRKFIEAAKRAS